MKQAVSLSFSWSLSEIMPSMTVEPWRKIRDTNHIEQNATGFGLRGMQERAVSSGGLLHITSQPGAGCQVLLILPLPQITV
jgi:signal transduction histidine kinase